MKNENHFVSYNELNRLDLEGNLEQLLHPYMYNEVIKQLADLTEEEAAQNKKIDIVMGCTIGLEGFYKLEEFRVGKQIVDPELVKTAEETMAIDTMENESNNGFNPSEADQGIIEHVEGENEPIGEEKPKSISNYLFGK